MSNKQTTKLTAEGNGVNALVHAFSTESATTLLNSLITAKKEVAGGPISLYHTLGEKVWQLMPVPGSKEPVGNRPADIVKTPRLNAKGEVTSTPQSTFKTLFDRLPMGERIAAQLSKLPAKGGTPYEVSRRDTLKLQRSYGVTLLKTCATLNYKLAMIDSEACPGVNWQWVVRPGKDGNIVRNRKPIKLFVELKAGEKMAAPDKIVSVEEINRLEPSDFAKSKGEDALEKLLNTKPHAAPQKASAVVPPVKKVDDVLHYIAALVNYADDDDNFKRILAIKDDETLRQFNMLANLMVRLEDNDEFAERMASVPDVEEKGKGGKGGLADDDDDDRVAA